MGDKIGKIEFVGVDFILQNKVKHRFQKVEI
jgi:hypothetical protein